MGSLQRTAARSLKGFTHLFGTERGNRARHAMEEIEKDKRGWVRHGIAALAISGLGLGVAGAITLTGSATEASGSAPAHSGTPAVSSAAPAQHTDGSSKATPGRSAQSPTHSGEPLDGTVDLSTRRDAQKNAKITDTSNEDASADQAATQRTKALQAASARSEKLSSKLNDQNHSQSITGAQSATGQTTGTDQSQDLTSATSGDGDATLPVAKGAYHIAATFGEVGSWSRYHTGIDFAAPIGTPIHATGNGVITNAGIGSASSWAGNYVTIKFANGQQMLFAHMSSVSVSAGQQVTAGQLIGHVGQTGRAFGPHTHVELYPAGVTPGDVYSAVDPVTWFSAHGLTV